jgi:hypothetical protein
MGDLGIVNGFLSFSYPVTIPRYSVRGPRPGSTDEDDSAVDKVHEAVLMLAFLWARHQVEKRCRQRLS